MNVLAEEDENDNGGIVKLHRWICYRDEGGFEVRLPGSRILRDKFDTQEEALEEIKRQLYYDNYDTNTKRRKGYEVPQKIQQKIQNLLIASKEKGIDVELDLFREDYYMYYHEALRIAHFGNFWSLREMLKQVKGVSFSEGDDQKTYVEVKVSYRKESKKEAPRDMETIENDFRNFIGGLRRVDMKQIRKKFQASTFGYGLSPTKWSFFDATLNKTRCYFDIRDMMEQFAKKGYLKLEEAGNRTYVCSV